MLTNSKPSKAVSRPTLLKAMHQTVKRQNNFNSDILPFRMSRTPVTNAIYKMFVDATGYKGPHHWENNCIPEGREQHPVVYVSCVDAQQFCQWAGVRLPTQHEWQLAAGGHYGAKYPWGSQQPHEQYANFGCLVGDTTPVGSYPYGKSHYGLLDMAGNVWEWTTTPYTTVNHRTQSAPNKTSSPDRAVCGGSFYDSSQHLECTTINWAHYDTTEDMIGFRVVLDLPHLSNSLTSDQMQILHNGYNAQEATTVSHRHSHQQPEPVQYVN